MRHSNSRWRKNCSRLMIWWRKAKFLMDTQSSWVTWRRSKSRLWNWLSGQSALISIRLLVRWWHVSRTMSRRWSKIFRNTWMLWILWLARWALSSQTWTNSSQLQILKFTLANREWFKSSLTFLNLWKMYRSIHWMNYSWIIQL